MMKKESVSRIGHILYVKKYQECLAFYKDDLNLSVLFQNEELTCFDLFGTYLMVEIDDNPKSQNRDASAGDFGCIRINVDNVKYHADQLKTKNVAVDYQEYSWGIVAKFNDPEGNLIAFKDELSFAKQIEDYKN